MARLTMAWTLLLSLLFSLLAFGASAGAQATVSSGKGTTQVHHMGIPYPAFSSHNSTHLGRFTHLQPRFQRLLRHGQDPNDKTQTAILVAGRPGHDDVGEATGARVVAALNPRNGEPVWRRIHNKTDPVTSMHTSSDVLVTLSGLHQTRVALFHALSGQELWSRTMDARVSSHQGVSDAALVPLSYTPPAGSGFAAAAPDVIVVDRDGTVQRFAGVNGRSLWVTKAEEEAQRQQDGALPVKVHATQQHVVVVYLVPAQASRLLSAFSSGQTYSLSVDVLSGRTGKRLSTFDVPGSSVDMASLPFPLSNSDAKTISNIAILGKDATDDKSIVKPQLVWLQRDGSVKSLDVVLPAGDDDEEDGGAGQVVVTISPSAITTVKPRQASRFVSLSEVPPLTTRGLIVAACNDGRGEVLRVDGVKRGIASGWEFEEEALDSVYAGSIDRKGQGFINRVFFGSGQKLLNFHVFWADANDGEGQVTGQSFQYDHDLHGDVFAAPFEVSQVSPFQLVTRATFVTASASVRMIQEDRHMWMREDGLSHTTASILIDLPEAKLGEGAAGEGDAARVILQGEGFLARLQRHAFALQDLPAWTMGTVTRIVQDIPGSMDNFKAFPLPGSKKGAAGDEDTTEMWKLPQNTMAQQQPPPPQQQQKPLQQQKRPLGGVAAADTPKRRPPPAGVPEVNTRRVTKPANPDDVPPPTSLAPRVADRANVTATLVRDAFGLRKLLVATSEKGKIYAMDSQTGRFIWEKSLVGFGDGEGAPVPKVEIKLLALTRPIGGAPAAVAVDAGGVAATTTTTAAAAAEEEEKQASAQLAQPGLLTVIAHVKPPGGITVTRMWEIDPLTGEFPTGVDKGQTGTALFVGDAKDSFLLPLQADETGGGGSQSVVGVVDGKTNHLHVYPDSPSVLKAFESLSPNFVFSFVEGEGSGRLAGYAVVDPTAKQAPSGRSTFASEKVWQVLFDRGEEVVQVARSTSLRDAVASQGKVLGNRQTLYKYLNPHALVVVTRDVVRRTAKVYVVDGIRGTILHEAVVAPEGKFSLSAAKPTVAFTENWITVSASVDVDEGEALAEYKGKHTQTRVVSIELYDVDTGLGSRDETWKWKGVFSSFASRLSEHGDGGAAGAGAAGEGQALAASPIQVFSQVYVLPYADGLRAMAATRTRHGITQKALLASSAGDASPSTGGGLLIQLPRRLLDPRRVTGGRKPTTAELEEGLSPYEAYVHDAVAPGTASRLRFATGSMQEADCITAAPALLESTSVVFVSGLDWLVASVTPSGTFDILSASFNKPQLILTIAVLSVGLAVTKPMVAAKFLKARW